MLTKSGVLWKNVNVRFFPFHRSQTTVTRLFINGLPSCVTSVRLDFIKYRDWVIRLHFSEICVRLREKCPHLKELMLTNSILSESLPSVIGYCTKFLQDVKNLAFHCCIFPAGYSVRAEFGGTSRIEVLDLFWCKLGSLNKPLFSRMPYLKVLCLYHTKIDNSWFKDDSSFLNQLHVLDVGFTKINSRIFPTIQNHAHNLKELCICGLVVQDHDLNFNTTIFPHLQSICIGPNNVTCEGVVSLIQSCPSLKNVYVNQYVAKSFVTHPFVFANRRNSGIVKAISWHHSHNVDYLHN